MKFFFADSQDLVDPSFDFQSEDRSPHRVRQRDDLYPHEVLRAPPYDGILVSKAIVDRQGRYTMGQRRRLLRSGVREFMRLDKEEETRNLETMGDCGAFAYVNEEIPPVSVDDVVDFYDSIGFDYGVSVDHIIVAFRADLDEGLPGIDGVPPEWRQRRDLTLELASEFLKVCQSQSVGFHPIGVAQGWSPQSYADSVNSLLKMGYTYIGLGGLVPLKTVEILSILESLVPIRHPETKMHLFGVTRIDSLPDFVRLGASSFDSTSPLRRAFKDTKHNYYTVERNYMAVRVPQVGANPSLKRRIQAGEIDQGEALKLERQCLTCLSAYDAGKTSLKVTLEALMAYEELCTGGRERIQGYEEVLRDQPWKQCNCGICNVIGIHVVMFRGAERNRRRGFHNLAITNEMKNAASIVAGEVN